MIDTVKPVTIGFTHWHVIVNIVKFNLHKSTCASCVCDIHAVCSDHLCTASPSLLPGVRVKSETWRWSLFCPCRWQSSLVYWCWVNEWLWAVVLWFFPKYTAGSRSVTVAHCHSDPYNGQTAVLYCPPLYHPWESLPCCSTLFSNEYFWYMQKQSISPDVIFMKSLMILISNSSGLWCAFLFGTAWHGF